MAITHKDISLLTQKATIAGTEKIPVSDTEYVTTNQIASLGGSGGGGGTGTVTSVGMTVPSGLSVSGSPITSSGTLAVSLDSGRIIPRTQAVQGGYNLLYVDGFYEEYNGNAYALPYSDYAADDAGDSQSAITLADDATVVHKTGNETITGYKAFNAEISVNEALMVSGSAKIYGDGMVGFGWLQDDNGDSVQDALDAKQATLVSGTNIKTINSTSLLGSGNIDLLSTSGGTITGGGDSKVMLSNESVIVSNGGSGTQIQTVSISPSSMAVRAGSQYTYYYRTSIQRIEPGQNPYNINLPSASGTLALTSDMPTALSDLTDDVVSGHYLPLTGGTITGDVSSTGRVTITDECFYVKQTSTGEGVKYYPYQVWVEDPNSPAVYTLSYPLASGTFALTSDIPSALSALSDDSTHRLVTDTEKSTWNAKQNAITVSSSEPTSSQGSNGDIWIVI